MSRIFNRNPKEEQRMKDCYISQIYRAEVVLGNASIIQGKRDTMRKKLRNMPLYKIQAILINKLQETYKK